MARYHTTDRLQTLRIVLLGHHARVSVLQTIAGNTRASLTTNDDCIAVDCAIGRSTLHFLTQVPERDILEARATVDSADFFVVVIDVFQYEPAIYESCAQLLEKNPSSEIILLFVNTRTLRLDKRHAVELLELIELDVREYLDNYGLDGDAPPWFYDSADVIADDRRPMGTSVMSVVDHIAK